MALVRALPLGQKPPGLSSWLPGFSLALPQWSQPRAGRSSGWESSVSPCLSAFQIINLQKREKGRWVCGLVVSHQQACCSPRRQGSGLEPEAAEGPDGVSDSQLWRAPQTAQACTGLYLTPQLRGVKMCVCVCVSVCFSISLPLTYNLKDKGSM